MSLKGQDVLVVLKLAVFQEQWSYRPLAESLGISAAELVNCLRRAADSSLIDLTSKAVNNRNLLEFLSYGVRYVFPARRGEIVRGFPTSFAAPPLNAYFQIASESLIPVWKHKAGTHRGYELEPIYPSVPEAARHDSDLYELLALIDAIREGRNRERNLALQYLQARLGPSENE